MRKAPIASPQMVVGQQLKVATRIKLNVGGIKFTTTLSTLVADPDSILAKRRGEIFPIITLVKVLERTIGFLPQPVSKYIAKLFNSTFSANFPQASLEKDEIQNFCEFTASNPNLIPKMISYHHNGPYSVLFVVFKETTK